MPALPSFNGTTHYMLKYSFVERDNPLHAKVPSVNGTTHYMQRHSFVARDNK